MRILELAKLRRISDQSEFLNAAYKNDKDKIMDLLENYKIRDVNITIDGWMMTPVAMLAAHGELDMVKYLVEKHHANINYMTGANIGPLVAAVDANQKEIVEYLLGKQAYVDLFTSDYKSILAYARDPEISDLLIEYGADVNAQHQRTSYNALMWVIDNAQYDVATTMIAAGANCDYATTDGISILHYACTKANTPKSLIQLLLVNGANINHLDNFNTPPLFYAITSGNAEIAEYLISVGADMSLVDKTNRLVKEQLRNNHTLQKLFPESDIHDDLDQDLSFENDEVIERDR